jgi:N-acetylneuraminic acid mutarotase
MKKQINPTIKAHLIRSAFYLLLLLGVCAIPFALAQRNAPTRSGANASKSVASHKAGSGIPYLPKQSQVPQKTSGVGGAHIIKVPRPPKAPQVVLYDQYDNGTTTATLSATFTDFPTFNADLADDFIVPGGQSWNVQSIDADGLYFGGAGPATSWNVFIYADSGGFPGTQVYSTLNQPVTVSGTTFTVSLSPAAVLASGTYWIEIQANMTFATEGEWGWTDRSVQSNNEAKWQNPAGGFAVCPSWTDKLTCIPTSLGPDQVYRINGTIGGGGTPSPTPTATATATGTPPACLVVNGGFETGDLPPWTDTGDTSFTAVNTVNPHSGSFSLQTGPTTSDGFIDQTIPTVAGQAYDVSFWLENDDTTGANSFGASFGSVTLVPEAVQSAFGYTLFTFNGVVPGANADLHFIFMNVPSYFYLDDVCVSPSGGASPTPTASPSCSPIVFNGIIGDGDPSQTDKLVASGNPQTCPGTTSCAIFGDPNQFRYDAYTFTNTTGSTQCVTIDTNTTCNGNHNIFTAAYAGSFDPANICTNWIGDSGTFPDPDQSFQVDVDSGQTLVVVVSEYHHAGCPGYTLTVTGLCGQVTPTPTPSGTPSCTPGGGSPGPWTQAAPVAVDHYGGFMDSDGTVAYEGGGYSFSVGDNITNFARFSPGANTWTALAAVPDLNNGMASAVYAPNVNKLFVFGGSEFTSQVVVNTTRIYDPATDTWSSGANMPDLRAFMASGYFNGKIYLVGGYSTGQVTPAFSQVWEYDPVANTFDTSRTDMPVALGGAGSGVVNGHLYVAGGRDINITNYNTLYDYDIASDTWTQRANLPTGVNVPGSAVIGGKLWVFGGGDPFGGPAAMPAKKHTQIPDTTNVLQVYDPASDSWTVGPSLLTTVSFPAGTDVGATAVAVGGYTGSNTTSQVEVNVTTGSDCSPTPTATPMSPTPTATFTPTPTASAPSATPTATSTATFTPTATATSTATAPPPSATPTATATATHPPRPTPTPRPAPTLIPHQSITPTPWPRR